MSNERLNLTLCDSLWSEVDRYRLMSYLSRQDFVRLAVVEYVNDLKRKEELETEANARLYVENRRLTMELNNLVADFKTLTGKAPRLRT